MFDVNQAVTALQSTLSGGMEEPESGWPTGAPAREYLRSPAAYHVAKYASDSGLYLFHYEHRAHLELPLDWAPDHDESVVERPQWNQGILPERKYQSFRHDQLIGSYHPGHRAKWATHELCHALVGYAWRPDASPLFTATAGRLAELLPVVLYYFFDECHLRRCPVHAHGGALFRTHCVDCERLAGGDASDPHVRERLADGLRYLDRELAAVARTRRLRRPVPHIWGSLDLCSDGLAYASAHGRRLHSETFHRYAELFVAEGEGWHQDLGALEERIVAVTRAILLDEPLTPWSRDSKSGRAHWIRQDIGWRMLCVAHQCEEDVSEVLHKGVAQFSDRSVDLTDALATLEDAYRELHEDVVLPAWEEVIAVGYRLPTGDGVAVEQVLEGVQSALPATALAYGLEMRELVEDFLSQDAPERVPLARRFGNWLSPTLETPLVDLVQYEVMSATVGPRDGTAIALADEDNSGVVELTLAAGIGAGLFAVQPVQLAEDVEFGDRTLVAGDLPDVDGAPVESYPCGLLCFRNIMGQLETVELAVDVAEILIQGENIQSIDEGIREALCQLGVLVPTHYALDD